VLPEPLAGLRGPTSKRREGRGREMKGRGRKREGRERKREGENGGERKGKERERTPQIVTWIDAYGSGHPQQE